MAFTQFTDDLNECLTAGIPLLFSWIHNNPAATGAQAKDAIKSWLDANYAQFATVTFGNNLVDRLLPLADGTWAGFRNTVLTYHDFLEAEFLAGVEQESLPSPAVALREWLLKNGGVESLERNGPKNWVTKTTLSDGTYTVEKVDNPTEVGRFIEPNYGTWSEV